MDFFEKLLEDKKSVEQKEKKLKEKLIKSKEKIQKKNKILIKEKTIENPKNETQIENTTQKSSEKQTTNKLLNFPNKPKLDENLYGKFLNENLNCTFKYFKSNSMLQKNYQKFVKLRLLEIPTYKNYHKFNKTTIIIPNFLNQDEYCVSLNFHNLFNKDAFLLKTNRIQTIENFEDLVYQLLQISQKLVKNKIKFYFESLFFIVTQNYFDTEKSTIKIIVGDFDNIEETNKDFSIKIDFLYLILHEFIYQFVAYQSIPYYEKKLKQLLLYEKVKQKSNLKNN